MFIRLVTEYTPLITEETYRSQFKIQHQDCLQFVQPVVVVVAISIYLSM